MGDRPWLNALAGFIVGVLLLLSAILMINTVFPNLDVRLVMVDLTVAFVVSAAVTVGVLRWSARRKPQPPETQPLSRDRRNRSTWRMPPLALLQPVTWTPGTRLGMLALRGYLLVSAVVLVVKVIQLGRM
ncbi:hypothetical protein [Mycobacterium sp.]|uniref:hypothetical protein n=1 Tax=Mycobacterium sp. TaxID=1785 RepID=UPI00344D808F